MSRARLFSKWGPTRDLEFAIGDEATIGRSRESTVRLEDRSVSAQHARLVYDAERDAYYLEDLDSLNGTQLDGVRVRGRERLERLHLLDFGGSSPFLFVRGSARGSAPAAAPTADEERQPAPSAPENTSVDREIPVLPAALEEASERAESGKTAVEKLAVMLPDELGEPPAGGGLLLRVAAGRELDVRLAEGDNVVGRALDAAVRIEASEISRRHAVLRLDGRRVFLRDLDSRNQTFLEGERVAGEAEVEIRPPARLRFGTIEAELVTAPTEGDG